MRFVKTCVSTKVADSGFVLSHIVVCYIVVYYVKSAWTLDRLGVSRPARAAPAFQDTGPTRYLALRVPIGDKCAPRLGAEYILPVLRYCGILSQH